MAFQVVAYGRIVQKLVKQFAHVVDRLQVGAVIGGYAVLVVSENMRAAGLWTNVISRLMRCDKRLLGVA